MPPYKIETDDVWSSHLLNNHEFMFGNMDVCYQFLQYGIPNFNFAWFPMDQSKGIISTIEFNNKNKINGCCPITNCKFYTNSPEFLENHLEKNIKTKSKSSIWTFLHFGNLSKSTPLTSLMRIISIFSTSKITLG
jgi:hypothetical protein